MSRVASSRVARLRSGLKAAGLDALLVSSLPNIRYLGGFTGSNALLVVTKRGATFLTDTRYTVQSKAEVRGARRIITREGLVEAAAAHSILRGCRTVGFESSTVTYATYRQLRRAFPGVVFKPTAELVENLALIKDADELACIRRAAAITDRVFTEVLPLIRPGVTELEIAAELTYRQKRLGAEHDSFEPIVAAGERAALPHARPTGRRIRSGEMIILDFGCTVSGYCSDLTRTVCVGRAKRDDRRIYQVVHDAQRAALDAVRDGIACRELDAVARRRIHAAGYGPRFIHSLGHGIGLHIHERPRVSHASTEHLRAGSVITIEPGIYLPGRCGVRIEDDVLVTRDGPSVLTTAPKELIVL